MWMMNIGKGNSYHDTYTYILIPYDLPYTGVGGIIFSHGKGMDDNGADDEITKP